MYARTVDGMAMTETLWYPIMLGDALERLGRLAEEAGEVEQARDAYSRLAQLWEGADAELQPRVEHARQRAAALAAGN